MLLLLSWVLHRGRTAGSKVVTFNPLRNCRAASQRSFCLMPSGAWGSDFSMASPSQADTTASSTAVSLSKWSHLVPATGMAPEHWSYHVCSSVDTRAPSVAFLSLVGKNRGRSLARSWKLTGEQRALYGPGLLISGMLGEQEIQIAPLRVPAGWDHVSNQASFSSPGHVIGTVPRW